jgi:hypothetical protein
VTAEDMNYLNALISKQSFKHGVIVDSEHSGITVTVSKHLPNIQFILCDVLVKYGNIYEPVASYMVAYHTTIKLRNNAMHTELVLTHEAATDDFTVTVTNTINQPIQ